MKAQNLAVQTRPWACGLLLCRRHGTARAHPQGADSPSPTPGAGEAGRRGGPGQGPNLCPGAPRMLPTPSHHSRSTCWPFFTSSPPGSRCLYASRAALFCQTLCDVTVCPHPPPEAPLRAGGSRAEPRGQSDLGGHGAAWETSPKPKLLGKQAPNKLCPGLASASVTPQATHRSQTDSSE